MPLDGGGLTYTPVEPKISPEILDRAVYTARLKGRGPEYVDVVGALRDAGVHREDLLATMDALTEEGLVAPT